MSQAKRSIFDGACPDRIAELETFTESGEASEELLAHIDSCAACSGAVWDVSRVQAESLEKLGRIIQEARIKDADGAEEAAEPRTATMADRMLAVLAISTAVGLLVMVAAMVAAAYGVIRDQDIARSTEQRVEVLFPGAVDGYCDTDPASLCHLGGEASACAAAESPLRLSFPAPTKVFCPFKSWPQTDPAYGAAFLIVDGQDIIGYRYADCPAGQVAAACASGPRTEVSRWRAAPGASSTH